MGKSISIWLTALLILTFGGVFTYITIQDLNEKKEHLRENMINQGELIIHGFEAASREFAKGGYRKSFWINQLILETSRLPNVKYIFIASPKGQILTTSVSPKTNASQLKSLAKESTPQKELSWKILNNDGKETLIVYRKISPDFLPDNRKIKNNRDLRRSLMKKHHQKMKEIRSKSKNLSVRFYFSDKRIVHFNPEDLAIFLALDMNIVQSRINNEKKILFNRIKLFALASILILTILFIYNYRSARISLGRAKKFSNAIIEAMPAGFIAIGLDGEIVSYNDSASSLFNLSQTPNKLPEELIELINSLDKEKLKESSINQEIVIHKKHLDLNISYIHAGADEKPGILILIKDETEKNALKNEITLNQRLATVGKLAAGVAHEIRNPLSSIKGFSTCINENPTNTEQNLSISKLIINEVDRLDKVVGQLLDFSKPLHLIREDVELKRLITEIFNLISPETKAKNISMIDNTEPIILTSIDKDKIKQVILNILCNSVEALDKNGTIEVSSITLKEKIIIIFRDSGPGIPEKIMPHIFDPYYTTKSTGTGLGLAISRNIVQAHHGKIYAETSQSGDTIFYIELPTEKI